MRGALYERAKSTAPFSRLTTAHLEMREKKSNKVGTSNQGLIRNESVGPGLNISFGAVVGVARPLVKLEEYRFRKERPLLSMAGKHQKQQKIFDEKVTKSKNEPKVF